MRKLIALLMALTMLASLAACGSSGGTDTAAPAETTAPAAEESAAPAESEAPAAEESEAPAEETEAPAEETEAPAFEGTPIETEFWTVTASDDWHYDEDALRVSEGSWSLITLDLLDEDENITTQVYIEGACESKDDYRDTMTASGLDAYDIVENGAGEYTDIGGVPCLSYQGISWGSDMTCYFGRVEGASFSCEVDVYGNQDDERIAALLDSLTFLYEDTGLVDPPWPWNGEPYSVEPLSTMVGTVTLSTEQIKFADSVVVNDIFSGRIAIVDNQVYLLVDGGLSVYTMEGTQLTLLQEIPLENEYDEIFACSDGCVYLSAFGCDLLVFRGTEQVACYDGPDYLAMAPDGTWGISYFNNEEVELYYFDNGTISSQEYSFAELTTISSVSISDNYIMVAGKSLNEHQAILVYDLSFNLLMTLGDKDYSEPDSLGSITAVFETENGFLALDGNMRKLPMWTKDGTYIGSAEDSELFGTSYPWLGSGQRTADGSIYVGMTEERADDSCDEFILFRMSGF